jgi:uncharacterized protein with GYD domain
MIPNFHTAEDRSNWIKANADMYTAVRFHGRGKYERHEFKDHPTAVEAAKHMAEQSGKFYMIYACAGIYDTWCCTIGPGELKL